MLRKEFDDAKEGDDTMSAVATNYSYRVIVKAGGDGDVPTISRERLDEIKKLAEQYPIEDRDDRETMG